ncbi:hypothetical protein POKO110462_15415 [Pontibacter korlensis]
MVPAISLFCACTVAFSMKATSIFTFYQRAINSKGDS